MLDAVTTTELSTIYKIKAQGSFVSCHRYGFKALFVGFHKIPDLKSIPYDGYYLPYSELNLIDYTFDGYENLTDYLNSPEFLLTEETYHNNKLIQNIIT